MATLAPERLTNIVSVTAGSDLIKGIRSVTIAINEGRQQAVLEEGKLYPGGRENLGTPEFPVVTGFNYEAGQHRTPTLVAMTSHTLVIVYKKEAGGANLTCTIVNHKFTAPNARQGLQGFGSFDIGGNAFSADGDTLPISYA